MSDPNNQTPTRDQNSSQENHEDDREGFDNWLLYFGINAQQDNQANPAPQAPPPTPSASPPMPPVNEAPPAPSVNAAPPAPLCHPLPSRVEFLMTGVALTSHTSRPASDEKCSICLETFENTSEPSKDVVRITQCGHFFHSTCLAPWFEDWNGTCPNCRAQLFRTPAVRPDAINPIIPPEFEQVRQAAMRRNLALRESLRAAMPRNPGFRPPPIQPVPQFTIPRIADFGPICEQIPRMYYSG
jgi:hypothetical protein